jgi:hypothetical protein
MTRGFLKVLNSDIVKDSKWIYGSRRGKGSVYCARRLLRPLEVKGITITTSKEIYGRLLLTPFQASWISVMERKEEEGSIKCC